MSPLTVGIAGCGKVSRRHIPALRAAHGVELVAAFDLDPGAARSTGVAVAGSLAELIGRVDLVAVCTPPETHAEVAVEALAAGRDVLVEKPLATTLEDADRIVAAAAGRLAATGFQIRCHRKLPPSAEVIHGVWGGPTEATVGPLLDRAVHHVDLWRALLGDEVAEASASRHNGGVRLEALMRGGATPFIDLPDDGPPRNVLVVDERPIDLYAMDGWRDRLRHPLELGRGGPFQSAFAGQWEAVAAGRPPATVDDGRRALEIVLGA
jgi:predicted dehydrogenase